LKRYLKRKTKRIGESMNRNAWLDKMDIETSKRSLKTFFTV